MYEAPIIVESRMDLFDVLLISWHIIIVIVYISIVYFVIKMYKKLNRYLNMRMKEMENNQ